MKQQKYILCSLFLFFSVILFSSCTPSDPDKVVNKSENRIVVAECEESQIENAAFPVNTKEAYRVGLNKEGKMIFYSTQAALEQLKEDYGEALAQLQEEFELKDVTERTIHMYGVLGWQSTTENEALKKECRDITDFFNIYEHSFKLGYYYDFDEMK